MAALSPLAESRARKNLASILKGLGSVGQVTVAEALDQDESTISKMKDKDLPRLAKMLAVLGLKVVPEEMKCFDPDKIGAILHLAKAHLASIENADQLGLAWDE